MKKAFIILLAILACSVLGQSFVQTLAFKGAAGGTIVPITPFTSPTNIAVVTNISWWDADNIGLGGTNATGSVSNWVDYGVSPNNLTNLGASSLWGTFSNAAVNGHSFVRFDGANDYLQSVNYTSPQPHTVVMVVNWWSGSLAASRYFFDSTDTTYKNYLNNNSGLRLTGTASGQAMTTNKWMVLEAYFNGNLSALFTNNVSSGLVIPVSANGMQGFVLANVQALGATTPIYVTFVATYRGSLGTVDSAGSFSGAPYRHQLYNYLTNRYAISQ